MDIPTTVQVTDDKVEVLQQFASETRLEMRRIDVRLSKVESTLTTFATKQEWQDLRNELKTEIQETRMDMKDYKAEIIKWIAGATLALGATGITVITYVLNNASPKAAPAAAQPTAPRIIQMPPWPAMPAPAAAPANPAGARR